MYTSALVVHAVRENDTVTIEKLNEELFVLHIPALVFVAACMVIGVLGNVLVIFIYKSKFRRSNHRYFILCLAAIDLAACLTGMPYLIVSLRQPYLMKSVEICKGVRYVHYFVNNSSGLLLVVISVERFQKICRPFKRQLTHRHTLIACAVTMIVSAIIGIPASIIFGKSAIDTGVRNLTGYQCYIADEQRDSKWSELYIGFLFVETIVCIAIFAVLYFFIIKQVWNQDKFFEAMKGMHATSDGNGESPSVSTDNLGLDVKVDNSRGKLDDSASSSCLSLNRVNGTETNNRSPAVSAKKMAGKSVQRSVSDSHALKKAKGVGKEKAFKSMKSGTSMSSSIRSKFSSTSSQPSTKHRKRSRTTRRVTIMLFTISVMFAVAFVPHLTLMYITIHTKGFLNSLTADEVMVYQLFLRIFIINNIVNPIIYGFCDKKFRVLCMALIRNIFKRS